MKVRALLAVGASLIAFGVLAAPLSPIAPSNLPGVSFVSPPVSANFGVLGDIAIPVVLPPGFTQFRPVGLLISQCNASLAGMTFGLYTASGGGGGNFAAPGSVSTVTNNTPNTNNNAHSFTGFVNVTSQAWSPTAGFVYLKVGATVAATCQVSLNYLPFP